MGVCEERRQMEGSCCSKITSGCESEESSVLEASTREWLVKT
jgi:hypothetical protein